MFRQVTIVAAGDIHPHRAVFRPLMSREHRGSPHYHHATLAKIQRDTLRAPGAETSVVEFRSPVLASRIASERKLSLALSDCPVKVKTLLTVALSFRPCVIGCQAGLVLSEKSSKEVAALKAVGGIERIAFDHLDMKSLAQIFCAPPKGHDRR